MSMVIEATQTNHPWMEMYWTKESNLVLAHY